MFGAYVRGAVTIVIAVLAAGLLEFLIPFLLPYQGPESSLLYTSFAWLGNNALMLMLAAIAAGILARALVEAGPGGI